MRHLWIGLVCAAFVVGCNGNPTSPAPNNPPSNSPNNPADGSGDKSTGKDKKPGPGKPGPRPPDEKPPDPP
jgi:hypothetical protein